MRDVALTPPTPQPRLMNKLSPSVSPTKDDASSPSSTSPGHCARVLALARDRIELIGGGSLRLSGAPQEAVVVVISVQHPSNISIPCERGRPVWATPGILTHLEQVIEVQQWAEIRRMGLVDSLSIRAIERRTGPPPQDDPPGARLAGAELPTAAQAPLQARPPPRPDRGTARRRADPLGRPHPRGDPARRRLARPIPKT